MNQRPPRHWTEHRSLRQGCVERRTDHTAAPLRQRTLPRGLPSARRARRHRRWPSGLDTAMVRRPSRCRALLLLSVAAILVGARTASAQSAASACLQFARCVAGDEYASRPPVVLFDGRDLSAWMSESGGDPGPGWSIVGDTLHLDPRSGRGGNLLSREQFGSFVLCFEWKIAPRGNSGIKYKVRRYDGRILGIEYQILDDPAYPRQKPKGRTASIYDLYAPVDDRSLRPAGHFNAGAIVVRGRHIEHWLNGQLVTKADIGSQDWFAHKAASKFKDVSGFGENSIGRIMLTDHRSEVWYRNIVLVPLAVCEKPPARSAASCPPRGTWPLWPRHCPCECRRPLRRLLAPLQRLSGLFCRDLAGGSGTNGPSAANGRAR